MLREPGKEAKVSPFAVFVAEKLEKLDPKNKLIAEKKIADILFEMEMSMYKPPRPNFGSNAYQAHMTHTYPQQTEEDNSFLAILKDPVNRLAQKYLFSLL